MKLCCCNRATHPHCFQSSAYLIIRFHDELPLHRVISEEPDCCEDGQQLTMCCTFVARFAETDAHFVIVPDGLSFVGFY